jgi:TolB-like protein/TolA-binding protein
MIPKKNVVSKSTKILFVSVIGLILLITLLWMFVIKAPRKPVTEHEYDKSIAVLPFVDMSPQKDQEYFCDGISEEIINALSKLKNVRVIARTSAFSFKGKTIDVREIGRRLDVKTLLEGSVRKSGSQLRITAQLINVVDGSHLWSETYDRKQTDIFAIQEDIARNIVDKLKIQIRDSIGKPLVNIGTDNLEAYHYYLKGMNLRYYSRFRIQDYIPQIINNFKQAIKLDPGYAQAHAQLAIMLTEAFYNWGVVGTEALAEAKEAAVRAVELDDTLPAASEALGRTGAMGGKWEDSEKYYRKAIELDPSYSLGYLSYAKGLMYVYRYKEAYDYYEKARELDPLNQELIELVIWSRVARYDWAGAEELIKDLERIGFKSDERFVYFDYAWIMLLTGRIKEAEEKIKEGLLLNPRSLDVMRIYAELLSYKGKYDDALKQNILALERYPNSNYVLWNIGYVYLRKGQYEEALKTFQQAHRELFEKITLGRMGKRDILSSYAIEAENAFNLTISGEKVNLNTDLPHMSPYHISCLYAALGDKEKMFYWLDKAYNICDYDFARNLSLDFLFAPYKNEPRFKALLKKMNLEP